MERIPFIIGYGGINAAGLSSTDQAYLNMVASKLGEDKQRSLIASLCAIRNQETLTGLDSMDGDALQSALAAQHKNFFIRQIPPHLFNTRTTPYYRFNGKEERFPISFAATLPDGFELSGLYNSLHHPRGLQLAVFAANDALGVAGLDSERIHQAIEPHRCAVYAGSALGQLDQDSMEGMLTAVLRKKKTITKQLPFSYPQMAADFVNAYVLKNVGQTGNQCGACATFLYNLSHAVTQIKSGEIELALVGASEAPIMPQIITAFYNMGALTSDQKIASLNPRYASIPFGDNHGFVMAEAAQFVVLASTEAAYRLGAIIYGMVSDVFISADGGKHSISAPGPGNYVTVGRAAAALERLYGREVLRHKSYVQAHGTSTPQNRVTESHIFSSVAGAFGIDEWDIVAIKSYIGHSQAAAGGDQLVNSLSFWQHGILPGIESVSQLAEDVVTKNLRFNLAHKEIGIDEMDAVLVNAKGFGGNNATAVISSPKLAQTLFVKQLGSKALRTNHKAADQTEKKQQEYLVQASRGKFNIRYDFDNAVVGTEDVKLSRSGVQIRNYPKIRFDK